ncbi:NADH:flavin oxidoreductase [Mycolicibacterium sp. YH-1]|uniref:NADH:flavin oxidoreductase n=1 Tax=Mycolicibacterium sp. YH-1 TaxID=2908837 RepID=UPI001F4C4B82|nr:NADH:flavin oxidoreductase [Mycolicibacterium sp. YH-1]UNB51159.1 NADH:flavin oxidoreductase [Mycolicibacterium sp. YH-1]
MNTPPNVFTPAQLGPVTLRNRIIKSATFEASSPNSLVTDDLIEFHRLPAAGGVGMTTVAYLAVTPGGRTQGPVIWWRPEAIPGLRTLTDAIHAEGAAVSAQIAHAGPVADAQSNKTEALAPMTSKRARGATRDDIDDIVAAHASAARFAIDAGFDAVEIHLGHGYFVSSFLSPLINKRDDEFGGSLQNRAKVARSVVEAVRRAVDDAGAGKIAVTAKLNMADGVDGGITVEESLQTAKWLQDDGCLDAIELTAGSSLVNPMYTFRGGAPGKDVPALAKVVREYPYYDAYLLDDARLFRAELTMPLILLGGITHRETMDLAMAEGFEFIAMGRALLAEPDLLNRIKADGDAHTVRSVCTHTNDCVVTIYSHTHCVLTGSPG